MSKQLLSRALGFFVAALCVKLGNFQPILAMVASGILVSFGLAVYLEAKDA